jgi:hypothetical protein
MTSQTPSFQVVQVHAYCAHLTCLLFSGGETVCEVGSCVVGRWEGGWYRGRVVTREGDRAKVLFVDYGNIEIISCSNLRLFSKDDDLKLMVQAIRCRFAEMKDMGEWEKKIEMQEYKVMLVCCGVDDMKVTLVREVEAVLVEGKETPVVVSHVKQQEVWVNQVLQMGQLDKMMSQLEELSGGLTRIFGELTVGRLAVGKFSQDGLMYRVVVEEVLREEERVVVRYLDFGNEEELDYGDLFELPADLLCVPQLAVCVKVLVVEENKLEEMLDMENVSGLSQRDLR